MIATGLIQNLREGLGELLSSLTVFKDAGSIIKISLQPSLFFLLATDFFKKEGKVNLQSKLLESKNCKKVLISRVLWMFVEDNLDDYFSWGNNPATSHTNAKN